MKIFLALAISIIILTSCEDPKSQLQNPNSEKENPKSEYVELNFKIDVHTPTVGIYEYKLITNNPGRDSIAAREIIQAKVLLPLAMQKHDSILFDSVLASNFLYEGEEAFFNRAEYIEDRVNGKWMISDVQYENLVLEFFGDYGVLTYRNKVTEKDENGKDQLFTWFWADVWIKEKGKWKLRDLRALN
ncbi:MAG TPA: nuclear transport factor 2 family protein [Saprospiraceae bacterium]|nr:nuclear transport factor 2 family protein [Saprospiraceae bacterium]